MTYAVTIDLTAPPDAARAGMSAKASVIIAWRATCSTFPSVALKGSALGYTVPVLGATARPSRVTSTVGLVTSTQAEIKSGLQPGETVVIGTTATQTTTTGGGGFGSPARRRLPARRERGRHRRRGNGGGAEP